MHNSVKNNILLPEHIRQIAKALHTLENNKPAKAEGTEKMPVQVVHTDVGLYLSKGVYLQDGKVTKYYTISFKNGQALTPSIISKLATIIGHIDKNEGSFTISKKNNGISQILFESEVLNDHYAQRKI